MYLNSIWSALEESYGVCSDASAPAIEKFVDRYFFAPWNCLSESELEELFNLSMELRDGLKKSEGK